MRVLKKRIPALLAAAVLVFGLIPAAFAAPSDPFRGAWRSVDAFDDSNQKLNFGGSGDTRQVKLFDDNATGGICLSGGPAVGRGVGVVDGNTIEVTFDITCADGGTASGIVVLYEYDSATNTLSDTFTDGDDELTTTWFRPGA